MAIRTFKCTVTRTDKYEIELDDSELDGDYMKVFREGFYDFYSLEEHAEYLAQYIARFGTGFIEGYGVVPINGKLPYPYKNDERYNDKLSKKELAININIISDDDDCEVEVEEI